MRSTRGRQKAGYTLTELMVSLALVAMTLTVWLVAWNVVRSRTAAMQAARTMQSSVQRARMLAVLRGVNHFVVLDLPDRTISVVADSTAPFGELNAEDEPVASDFWPSAVSVGLPSAVPALPNPLGGDPLSDGWSLPAAQGGAWTAEQRGIMLTPIGTIQSAESSPSLIDSGVVVFADDNGVATSVAVRGQFGTVRWYRYTGAAWKNG